jgi:formylglycine-generating enzyme required for sulfatase activity
MKKIGTKGLMGFLLGMGIVAQSLIAAEPAQSPERMALVPAGIHKPLFRTEQEPTQIEVKAFYLDQFPVSNGEYLEFVTANPKWRRSNVKELFADANYLKHWSGDLELGTTAPEKSPVVNVSWFAARAFASWKGKRLPTTTEWEYAANASETRPDGENDPAFKAELLKWLTSPAYTVMPDVGRGKPNLYGLYDMHGLAWEWVADFNNSLVTGESRADSGLERNLFCAGGSQDAKDRGNYPAFMRYAFRSSLQANYTVHNLGFRCAKNVSTN